MQRRGAAAAASYFDDDEREEKQTFRRRRKTALMVITVSLCLMPVILYSSEYIYKKRWSCCIKTIEQSGRRAVDVYAQFNQVIRAIWNGGDERYREEGGKKKKTAGLRHLLRRYCIYIRRHNIIPKCSLRPVFDSHLLPPLNAESCCCSFLYCANTQKKRARGTALLK